MSAEATAKVLGLADDMQAEYAAAHVNTKTGEIIESLTADEAARLRVKESAIERGADEVARALSVIRDERLYRASYTTFEAYCRERWGMSRSNVDRQIIAAEVAETLTPIGVDHINPGQARELADLRDNPDELRDTYQRAVEATGGNVTAAAIRDVRHPQTPAPTTEGEAEVGAGQTPASPLPPAMRGQTSESHPLGEAGPYSSGADAVGATAPEVSEAFERHVMGDAGVMAARYRATLASAMARAAHLPAAFRPEDVAGVVDADVLDSIERLVKNVTEWRDDIKRQSSGLRVIKGGMR